MQKPRRADAAIWVWAAWLEHPGAPKLVYACAARCFCPPTWEGRSADIDIRGVTLIVREATVEEASFQRLADQLRQGSIDLTITFGAGAPVEAIRTERRIFAAGLGQTAVPITSSYSMPDLAALLGGDNARLPILLSRLQDDLGLPFKGALAARLGSFDVFDLHPWLDRQQPFHLEAKSIDLEGGPAVYRICRTVEFASVAHAAHVVGRVNGDVIVDRLIRLAEGQQWFEFETPERLDKYDFSLFDADGNALHAETSRFMDRIDFVLSPIHRQVQIQDALSTRAAQGQKRPSIVQSHSSIRSQVGAPKPGSWRKFAEDMAAAVAAATVPPSEDRWFARGIEGELGAIAELNGLMNGGRVSRAVLVDPWFGVEALTQLALRLTSVDVEITILTSWVGKHPDTGERLNAASSTQRLEEALEKVRPFLNPKVTVLNLVDGDAQAFHDRYLLLYPHEAPAKVFLLSNSLNAAGRNWPFSMSLFAPDVSPEITAYIEGLRSGKDITRNKELILNLRWQTHASPATR